MAGARRVLLEGRPGVGKTTVARRLVDLLRERGFAVAGFTTAEIRVAGRRVGFEVESTAGERAVLAHVDRPGPPRVGKYGVDVPAFERVALPALTDPPPAKRETADEQAKRRPAKPVPVVIVDEVGKMELASAPFCSRMTELLDSGCDVVATVHVHRHPFTDALKAREDVRVVRVTESSRDRLPLQLAAFLTEPGRRLS